MAWQLSYNDVYGWYSICLDSCGIGVWSGTSGVAALISCTSPCVFCCCISRNFAFGGRSVTLVMDYGTIPPTSCLD